MISENSIEPYVQTVVHDKRLNTPQANHYNQAQQKVPSNLQPTQQPQQQPNNTQEQPKNKPSTAQRSTEQILQSGLRAAEEAGATQEQLSAWLAMDNEEAIKEIRLFVIEVAQKLQKANQANAN